MHSFSASVGQRGQLAVVAPVGVGGQQVSVRIDGGDVAEIVIGEGIYRTGGGDRLHLSVAVIRIYRLLAGCIGIVCIDGGGICQWVHIGHAPQGIVHIVQAASVVVLLIKQLSVGPVGVAGGITGGVGGRKHPAEQGGACGQVIGGIATELKRVTVLCSVILRASRRIADGTCVQAKCIDAVFCF